MASDAADNDIPLQGAHRGDADDPVTTSVRGQTPPDPTPPAEHAGGEDDEAAGRHEDAAPGETPEGDAETDLGDYQLSRDEATGRHRIRVRPPADEDAASGGGFREISRHSSPEDMSKALDGQASDGPRFLVLENTETGEKRMDREGAIGTSWMAEGRYDQATLFDDENEAAAYADE